MESISNKSDRNFSIKNKNTVSYKSVSELSEFEEMDEEPSDFVINTKKKEKSQNKLNESMHSVASNFSKEVFEDKDEDKN
jgi:hypothetical protein